MNQKQRKQQNDAKSHPPVNNKTKKQPYFKKANDIYDLGDSFPSLYCASVNGSEIVTLQTEAHIAYGSVLPC